MSGLPRALGLVALGVVVLGTPACSRGGSDRATSPPSSSDSGSTGTTVAGDPADTTATDAAAEAPPSDQVGEDDGLDDSLVFVADLDGAGPVPGPGDPDAVARVEIVSDPSGALCFDVSATGLGSEATVADVHRGREGEIGDAVVSAGAPTSSVDGTDTWTHACATADAEVVDELNTDPGAFYADIHTVDFEAGAIRAQLRPATIFDLRLS